MDGIRLLLSVAFAVLTVAATTPEYHAQYSVNSTTIYATNYEYGHSATTTVTHTGSDGKKSVTKIVSTPKVKVEHKPEPLPSFPVDFSTTEASLRTYIFQQNIAGAAEVLSRPQVVSLGAGLTYPEELSILVEPTLERNSNPDVIAFKAIAKSALADCEPRKLATAAVLSFTPDCACSVFTSEEEDQLIEWFTKAFSDPKRMKEILFADANTDFVPPNGLRRLAAAGASPVNSFTCSSCWPSPECSITFWCDDDDD